MIDLHAHILPAVDDGARNEADSILMLQAAKEAGVTAIVATPHVRKKGVYPRQWEAVFQALYPRAARMGIQLTLGCELNIRAIRMDADFGPFAFALDGSRRFVLLELDNDTALSDAAILVSTIAQQGITPIFAHPERVAFVQKNPHTVSELRAYGAASQVDASSMLMPIWHPYRRSSRKLLHNELIDCVASDAHRPADYEVFARATHRFGIRLSSSKAFQEPS